MSATDKGDQADLSNQLKNALEEDAFGLNNGSSVKKILDEGIEVRDDEGKILLNFNKILPKSNTTDVGKELSICL